ncbi:MAG: 4Fe-4S dicluster domain-containing protein [Bacillota bacterium]
MAKGSVKFNEDICKGCQICLEACPVDIIKMDESRINVKGFHPATVEEMDKCIGCGNCAISCPDSVISVERE